jgi:FkbM family methyltransferase
VASALAKLRPAKIRNGARRRRFEFLLERTPLREGLSIVEVGSDYGGWALPENVVQPSWTCYCVGAGGDVTFDLELIRRYGVHVRAIDPVPAYIESALAEAGGDPRFSVYQAAIATRDGPLRMQVTHHTGSSSVSAAGLYESDSFIELPGRTLPSLMGELGDERVELLKLDIEGAEYDVMETLDLRAMGVQIFATQLHHAGTVARARALIDRLRQGGYVPVAVVPAVKVTFVAEEMLGGAA